METTVYEHTCSICTKRWTFAEHRGISAEIVVKHNRICPQCAEANTRQGWAGYVRGEALERAKKLDEAS